MIQKRRKEDKDIVDKWWHKIRAYWHILSYAGLIIYMATTQWNTQTAQANTNAKDILVHETRIKSMETWRETTAPDIAAIKQEVHDIHERIVK